MIGALFEKMSPLKERGREDSAAQLFMINILQCEKSNNKKKEEGKIIHSRQLKEEKNICSHSSKLH